MPRVRLKWNGTRFYGKAKSKWRRPMLSQKPREGSRRAVEREMHALVRQIVIPRDVVCVCCGSTNNLEVGHFFSRTNKSIAWDLVNCNVQCHDCNQKHNSDQSKYWSYMIRKYGWTEIDRLNRLRWANEYIPYNKLIEMRDALKAQVKEGLCVEAAA